MNFKKFLASSAISGAVLLNLATPAFADQNAIGAGFSSAPAGSIGPLISGEFYGNTSNPSDNGNGVIPSWSPGPWVCGNPADCEGPTNPGGSMGDFLAPIASDGSGTPDFANGNDPDIDFSLH